MPWFYNILVCLHLQPCSTLHWQISLYLFHVFFHKIFLFSVFQRQCFKSVEYFNKTRKKLILRRVFLNKVLYHQNEIICFTVPFKTKSLNCKRKLNGTFYFDDVYKKCDQSGGAGGQDSQGNNQDTDQLTKK